MLGNALDWLRSIYDPLSSAKHAGRWIAQLPASEAIAIQREALELVSGFPGSRKEPGPGQVEALLRIDARHCRAHAYGRCHELHDLALRLELFGDAVYEIKLRADEPPRVRLRFGDRVDDEIG